MYCNMLINGNRDGGSGEDGESALTFAAKSVGIAGRVGPGQDDVVCSSVSTTLECRRR